MRKPVLILGALGAVALVAAGTQIATAGAQDDPSVYEAEASTSTLAGGARVGSCSACSGGKKVGWIGANRGVLTFTNVRADAAGPATVTITYATRARRSAQLSVNGAQPTALAFNGTGSYTRPGTVTVTVTLTAGANTLRFSNPTGWAPDLDKIQVRSAAAPAPSASTSPDPTTPPSPDPTTPPSPADPIAAAEAEVVRLVNVERGKVGCSPVAANDALARAARDHSTDMAKNNYFSHTSLDGTQFADRISRAGYQWRGAGENIAKGQRTPADVMSAWMNSSGHRANIVNCGFRDLGVGLAYDARNTPLWTQDFGTPR
jgi:uncharacterized protein YkwD